MRRLVDARLLTLSLLIALLGVVAAPGGNAASKTPGLRLISILDHVDAVQFPDSDLFIPSGVYIAATGGAFEIDATATSSGSAVLWQVTRDANGVHRIRRITPAGPVAIGDGLPAFFHATLTDSSGKTVASSDAPFCPSGGFGNARADATGPDKPSFPYFCGSALTKRMVWGLDKGWATVLAIDLPPQNIPDGDYRMTLAIASTYRRQLGIPSSAGAATFDVTVTTETDPGPCPAELPCPFARAATTGGPKAHTEGPYVRLAETQGTDGIHGVGAQGLPNLEALPAHDFSVENNPDDGHDYLNFGATIWNGGSGPFVVEGFRSTSAEVMKATQFIYRKGVPSSSAVVGEFEFDHREGHDHWHMEDVAQYDLLDSSGGRVVLSGKQSFCLAPTDPVDLLASGADWQPDRVGLWSSCAGEDAIWLREVLPAGWGDTYFQSVAGQSFDITNLPNGRYLIRVTTNPFHRFKETTFADNASVRAVDIGGVPGNRTIAEA